MTDTTLAQRREQLIDIMKDAAKDETKATLRAEIARLTAANKALTGERDAAEIAKIGWFETHLAHRTALDALGNANGELLKRAMEGERRAERLSAELAEARKVLRPFARIAEAEDFAGTKDGESILVNVNLCRAARSFLSSKEPGQ